MLNLKSVEWLRVSSWSVLVPPDTLDTKFWNPKEDIINQRMPVCSHFAEDRGAEEASVYVLLLLSSVFFFFFLPDIFFCSAINDYHTPERDGIAVTTCMIHDVSMECLKAILTTRGW